MTDQLKNKRWHELDAVRMIALSLGIIIHSALSLTPNIDPKLWPIDDAKQSVFLSILVFGLHVFRMSTFFLLAGFLAHLLYQRRGYAEFWKNRLKRIALPLVLGWVSCLIAAGLVIFWLVIKLNGGKVPEALPPEFANAPLNFMHLWFLYILLWLYAIVTCLSKSITVMDKKGVLEALSDKVLNKLVPSVLSPVVLAIPIAIALILQKDWAWWMGVHTPGYTLTPPFVPLFIFTYIFGLGWLLYRNPLLIKSLQQGIVVRFFLGLVSVITCLQLAGLEVSLAVVENNNSKLIYAVCYATAIMSWTFTFIGLGVKYLNTPSPVIRYLSDASYWMYIAHLPVVMALQTLLMDVGFHWLIKFVFINLATYTFLIVTYRYGVRTTWIGVLLNGKRQPSRS